MPQRPIRLGLPAVPPSAVTISGDLVDWREGSYYCIAGYDAMEPFFTTVVSDSDLWMYVSSTGGLTAGRGSADHSLFPYETVDKLHVSSRHTGPRTAIRYTGKDETFVWEPFAGDGRMRYEIERSLFKHALGCELWFEERNLSLGLTFRYGWRPSEQFGWVRSAELVNNSADAQRIEILDGVQNLLPAGINRNLQDASSSLVDAYKSTKCDPDTAFAVYRLTAAITDRAEASEVLRATVAYQTGLAEAAPILRGVLWHRFALGHDLPPETELNGQRGSYLLRANLTLAGGTTRSWHIILDTPVDQADVARLRHGLANDVEASIESDIRDGREHLHRLLAGADALQAGGDPVATTHHVANVLFNIARGGVLPDQYNIDRDDLAHFLTTRNRPTADKHAAWLAALPASLPLTELHSRAETTADTNLMRLCDEYLPIVFSRRHGDPSRPWNQFSIVMKNEDGSPLYAYEGNWRDIFQNWEALCRSFPACIEPVIAKFVNASTVDGYNPYRITRDGIDWETADPDDPWSSIGYWGDHQIIYLLKLLETSRAHHPEKLLAWLCQDRFCYADVPYDIKPYGDIVADPQDTMTFNEQRQQASDERVDAIGSDGRLVHRDGRVVHVNLAEKLLVPILAKMSNLVPGGGIWMNTMRPEWNDANNALVGNGMSVVTACYLYRHLGFCADLFDDAGMANVVLSSQVAEWLLAVGDAIDTHGRTDTHGATDTHRDTVDSHGDAATGDRRRAFMDAAGEAFSQYRARAYSKGLGERTAVEAETIVRTLRHARTALGATIVANRRRDGLYHAYNILHLDDGRATISHLPLMLEGQVAALSSGLLSAEDSVRLLDALRTSALYREDQHTYLLYPEKQLQAFLEKNRITESILKRSPMLTTMVEAGDERIVLRDADGQVRFDPDFHNADALRARLDDDFTESEIDEVLVAYEAVFDHKAFTGRSGTMYGYEGIGCIYWHMIAKLLLAVQETFERAVSDDSSATLVAQLKAHYDDIRAGLGFMKQPDVFGAFPLDPYSHTPGFAGAKQPGMTGQVKEEILTRWGELGVHVCNGEIGFEPRLLSDGEFLTEATTFGYIDVHGIARSIALQPDSLAFTFCQVPVVYTRGNDVGSVIGFADGNELRVDGHTVPQDITTEVLGRTGRVEQITVNLTST